MSKTIKQIADELGVSKQAVQKRLSREPLYTRIQPHVYTQNGVKYIEAVGEKLIKSAFSKTGVDKPDNLSIDTGIDKNGTLSIDKSGLSIDMGIDKADLYTPMIEVLQATIDTLQGQLVIKDEQIRGQQAQIEQLTAALQQQTSALESTTAALTAAQALHAADKQALILMEDKEKQSDPFYSDENMERLQHSAEQMERTGEPVHSERKLSFWERRAAKKAEKKARKENKNG